MRYKRYPEDFQVDETTALTPSRGPFAFYRMTKRWIGTPEAIDQLLKAWNLPRDRVSYGGLKDFHGVTTQYLTVHLGSKRNFRQDRWDLDYLGQVPQPYDSQQMTGNRFRVVLREVTQTELADLQIRWPQVQLNRVPNYFDEQRFGSVGESGEFIAKPWCLGDYERALWLALADPNSHDRPDDQAEKAIIRELWGNFPEMKAQLPRCSRRSIVTFLVDRPGDFRGALARIRIDLRSLYLSAFQSHLWNELLASLIRQECDPARLGELTLLRDPVPYWTDLGPEQRRLFAETDLPLPAARQKLEPGLIADLAEQVVQAAGMQWRELRLKYPRDTFFSKGYRPATLAVLDPVMNWGPDDRTPGLSRVDLEFGLPRGCYATLVLKALGAANE